MNIKELILKNFPKDKIKDWFYFCVTRDGYCCFQKDRRETIFISINELVQKDTIDWDNIHKRNIQLEKIWKDLELVSKSYKMKQCENLFCHEAVAISESEQYFDEC